MRPRPTTATTGTGPAPAARAAAPSRRRDRWPSRAPATRSTSVSRTASGSATPCVYRGTTAGSLTGLQAGHVYYVVPDAANPERLSLAETAAAAKAGQVVTLGGDAAVTLSLQRLNSYGLETTVDDTGNALVLTLDNPFKTGDRVVFRGAVGGTVSGLNEGQIYYAIADLNNPKRVQLADSVAHAQAGTPVDIGGSGTSTAFFSREGQRAIVTASADTLTADVNFHFETGDAVVYRGTGGEPAISALTVGNTYYVIVTAANELKLADSLANAQAGTAVDLTADLDTTVWLEAAPSELRIIADARPALVVGFDVDDTVFTGTSHSFDPGVKGITISAKLTAEDNGKTKSGIGSEPKVKDFLTKGELLGGGADIFKNLGALVQPGKSLAKGGAWEKNPAGENIKNALPKGFSVPQTEFAGSFMLHFAFNDVLAEVGPNAKLHSGGNVDVKADLKHKTQQNVEATISRADPTTAQTTTKTSFSLGLAIGTYVNSVQAIVRGNSTTVLSSQNTTGPGAEIDAKKKIGVAANTNLPWVFPLDDPNTDANEAEVWFASDPVNRIASFLDGKLGLTGLLFNSWVRTTAKSSSIDKGGTTGLTGALALAGLGYSNNTFARVESGAKINQDLAYRSSDQTLHVTAKTNYELVHATGTFDIDLSPEAVAKARRKASGLYLFNPFGAQNNSGGGLGGSVHVLAVTNFTEAIVQDDVRIHVAKPYSVGTDPKTGKPKPEGGLLIDADTSMLNLAFGLSGAAAKTWAVGGALNVDVIVSETTAQLGSGAVVTTAAVDDVDLRVGARDKSVLVSVAGGLATSERIGAGVGIAVNVLDRKTQAVIGAIDSETRKTGQIDIGGEVVVDASNTGVLVAAGIAGAFVSPGASAPTTGGSGTSTTGQSGTQSASTAATTASSAAPTGNDSGQFSLALSGSVALNEVVEDSAIAAIDQLRRTDGGKNIRADGVTVTAAGDTRIGSFSGAVAVNTSVASPTSVGAAGAFSQNTLLGVTRAFISGSEIQTGALTVDAKRTGVIVALSAGVGLATGASGVGVGGSVGVNVLNSTTEAYLSGVGALLAGDSRVKARDEALIITLGGAVGFGRGKAGVGAALSVNVITDNTKAYLLDTDIDQTGGNFEVAAEIDNPGPGDAKIVAITGSVGASAQGEAVSGTISVNIVNDTAEAYLKNSSLDNASGTGLTVRAEDSSIHHRHWRGGGGQHRRQRRPRYRAVLQRDHQQGEGLSGQHRCRHGGDPLRRNDHRQGRQPLGDRRRHRGYRRHHR